MYGPNGLGILYMKKKWVDDLPPYQGGGGMINEVKKYSITFADAHTKFEAGTMQTAEVVAMSEAIKFVKTIGLDRISDYENKEDGILITGLPHSTDYSDKSIKKMINDMQTWKKVRMIGSAAMAACYIASGKAEMYKENGVYLWDIIAGAAIVESAGGFTDISNIQENFQVDVIFSNSHLKD